MFQKNQKNFEKKLMTQFQENVWTDGRMDGRMGNEIGKRCPKII